MQQHPPKIIYKYILICYIIKKELCNQKEIKMRTHKESEILHCKIDKQVATLLIQFCQQTGLSKTAAVERAIKMYEQYYRETGKI